MPDAIIARHGGSGNSRSRLITELIAMNTNCIMPNGVKNNTIFVRIFGGGDGGWMNNGEIIINPGMVIPVTIGLGGVVSANVSTTRGTSFFGSYLSANGGGFWWK